MGPVPPAWNDDVLTLVEKAEALQRAEKAFDKVLDFILDSAFETFDRMAQQIDQMEAEADGTITNVEIEDINAEGGDVTYTFEDSGTDPDIAGPAVDRLLSGGAQVILGAMASGVTDSFIQVLSDGQIPQCSGSNTSPAFTGQENASYYFRTVPPDEAVSPIIADVDGTGALSILVVAQDGYVYCVR